ncbi:flagellar basal body rod protein FlgB [Pseudooceanicola nanhaiensis]|uniref:flagellar basal body rod protein FlgB n=1 Tax=Pseudooceanicola nanhaiensis TaxID=375761 RepID=UPI001CD40254|nr:flagellar basal body protein [Pseudooceanicola nanhaiensis]MCA0922656.1 flagellar basal body protein [Pseudooceanicola nanhaiensis]
MSFFRVASERMKWLSARQSVISENIANANTPNYKARDVAGFDEAMGRARQSSGIVVTDAHHISGTAPSGGIRTEADDTAWETGMDGNNVVLEQQAITANEVSESYRMAAQLYKKGHDLLTLAVTGIR